MAVTLQVKFDHLTLKTIFLGLSYNRL